MCAASCLLNLRLQCSQTMKQALCTVEGPSVIHTPSSVCCLPILSYSPARAIGLTSGDSLQDGQLTRCSRAMGEWRERGHHHKIMSKGAESCFWKSCQPTGTESPSPSLVRAASILEGEPFFLSLASYQTFTFSYWITGSPLNPTPICL